MKLFLSLAALLVAFTLNAQELSEEAKRVKRLEESSSYTLSKAYDAIKQRAEKEWPADYEMQIYVINKQSKAFLQVFKYFEEISGSRNKLNIMSKALSQWGATIKKVNGRKEIDPYGADWAMVQYAFEKQLESYNKLKGDG